MKFKFLKSDLIGIGFGLLIGLFQGVSIFNIEDALFRSIDEIPFAVVFGLFAPPVLAIFNRMFSFRIPSFYNTIGKYINLVFLMIAFGIGTGISGFTYYWLFGGTSSTLFMLSFFSSAGIGFFFAYLIYPQLACRQPHDA